MAESPPWGALMSEPPMGPAEWLILVLLSIVWGGSFLFAKIALLAFKFLTIGVIRVIIGALINVTGVVLIDGGLFGVLGSSRA